MGSGWIHWRLVFLFLLLNECWAHASPEDVYSTMDGNEEAAMWGASNSDINYYSKPTNASTDTTTETTTSSAPTTTTETTTPSVAPTVITTIAPTVAPGNTCQDQIIPPSGECSSHTHKYHKVNISASSPCIFKCHYDPSQLSPMHLEVNLHYKHPLNHPTFIVAQQKYQVSSWTLPIVFPNQDETQKFTSIEQMLCPPTQLKNETVEIHLTTENTDDVKVQLTFTNKTFVLKKGDNVTVKATPVSPWVKLYQWDNEDSVLVTADSQDNSDSVCSILAIQNAKCPIISDEAGVRAGGTKFQTFTSLAGIVARKSEFPDGVHIIVVPLPNDDACTLAVGEKSNRTTRHKSVVLQVFGHATIFSTWYIFLVTGAIVSAIIIAYSILVIQIIRRNLSRSLESDDRAEDERSLLNESSGSGSHRRFHFQETVGVAVLPGDELHGLSSQGDNRRLDTSGRSMEEMEPLEHQTVPTSFSDSHLSFHGSQGPRTPGPMRSGLDLATRQPELPELPYHPPTTYSPNQAALMFTRTFNPRYVCWWNRLEVYESDTADALVGETGFQNNIIVMAVFTALPTAELVRSYLKMLLNNGQEDTCFFNSRCLTAFGALPDFARVFTNIGYILCGGAFLYIVAEHRTLTQNILKKYSGYQSVGVSHHYGLFISVGYGLLIQGLMSSVYHSCPNSVTIKFDMMFMYVVAVSAIVCLWGFRHGDVTHHVYPTMVMIGVMLLMAEAREWISSIFFWTVFSLIYGFLVVSNTVLLTKFGIWSFSPYKILRVWKGWKPVAEKVKNELSGVDSTAKSTLVVRIVIGIVVNGGIILFGCLSDPNVYRYILLVCLANMGMYFLNYLLSKKCEHERVPAIAAVSLLASIVLWVLALVAFLFHNTDSEASPSFSRSQNSPCAFFGVFDTHDAWHLLSSLALFTFFVGILTLDDDLSGTSSEEIRVF